MSELYVSQKIMLDDARNIIGDLASGKIKDQRLALLADELTASDRKLSDATAKLSILKSENSDLKSQVDQLESTLNHFRLKIQPEIEGRKFIDDEAQEMLETLFDADADLTVDRIVSGLSVSGSVAKFHLDTLLSARLVRHASSEPQPYMMGDRQTFKTTYELTPSGRKQVMLTRKQSKG